MNDFKFLALLGAPYTYDISRQGLKKTHQITITKSEIEMLFMETLTAYYSEYKTHNRTG
jgi:hypothetical protein